MSGLTNSRGIIVKIRSRDRTGRNIHKNSISIDDSKEVEKELRTWKDKLGVPICTFERIIQNPNDKKELEEVKELMKKNIDESNEKMKKAFSKV